MMTTKQIQEALCKYLAVCGREHICENFSLFFEMDVAALSKSRMLYEFEVKISRSDFLADKKKGKKWGKITKFEQYATIPERSPNYFVYVCPEGLIKEHEVPTFAGLFYYNGESITEIKQPKRIHKLQPPATVEAKMLRYHTQRKYLGGTMLTYLNRKSKEAWERLNREAEERLAKWHETNGITNLTTQTT